MRLSRNEAIPGRNGESRVRRCGGLNQGLCADGLVRDGLGFGLNVSRDKR
jgi:hypothetical protein